MRSYLYIFCAALSFMANAAISDENKTILVLDASGSMWGQIEGTAKISIAQSVVGDLLQSLPQDQAIGLTAYGHNRKGDCSDIETLVTPEIGNRDAIQEAVKKLNPKGKTPLSGAVLKAAEVLKYEENKATVILISDGVETCGFDPCEVGTQLEASGVDFTAHVVGFDVSAEEAFGLKCLADSTGGLFFSASDASELGDALKEVTMNTGAPAEASIRIVAREEASDFDIKDGLIWTLREGDKILVENQATADLIATFVEGKVYTVEVTRQSDGETVRLVDISYPDYAQNLMILTLPANMPPARITAASNALQGEDIELDWEGPTAEGDYIAVAEIGSKPFEHINRVPIDDDAPVRLIMPGDVGVYELRYVYAKSAANGDDVILATSLIEILEDVARLIAPTDAKAGETIQVEWNGPDAKGDYISIAKIGEKPFRHVNRRFVKNGSPLPITVPGQTGIFELRYVLAVTPANGDDVVLLSQELTVTENTAVLSGPASVEAGAKFSVSWTGPNYKGDYLSIAESGSKAWEHRSRNWADQGGSTFLKAPNEPGLYEMRYVLAVTNSNGDDVILATQQIVVE